MVEGYKAFYKDKTNRYGMYFEEGKSYSIEGDISFGNHGNGFHMCAYLEDVFRYFDAMDDEFLVAKVVGDGKIVRYNDEYNGFYDMYVVEKMEIKSFLTRDEIIEKMLSVVPFRACRFISLVRLNEEEQKRFKERYQDETCVLDHLAYYQEKKKDTFYKKYRKAKF